MLTLKFKKWINAAHKTVTKWIATAERPARVHISTGNTKMGKVASFSTAPGLFCVNCVEAGCWGDCYARKAYKQYPSTRKAWNDNAVIALTNPARIGAEVVNWLTRHKSYKLFRWHVSGDIPTMEYFEMMISVAERMPDVTFWAFTKNYEIVNIYLDGGRNVPENFTILFSDWDKWECHNPHKLPHCKVIDSAEDFPGGTGNFLCAGDCENCLICPRLKSGENTFIVKH